MNFSYPKMLWLLAATLPLLTLFLWQSWRRKQELIKQFVQSRLLAQLTVGVSKRLQKLRLVMVALAVTMVLLALAGPRWGFAWEEATQRGRDILVAIDCSRSMLATDLAPNRLARAKLAAIDLMNLAKTDRLGLIAFAGSAFLQCPLTLDDEAFRQSVQILDTEIIPQGGTAVTAAIEAALDAFQDADPDNHKVLVLFTDGEDHEAGALETAKAAAAKGLRIFTIGVGTAAGELLRVRDDKGQWTYVKDDQGNAVKSKLNEALLQQIATDASGFYLPLRGAGAMDTLYQRGLAPLPTSELSSKLVKRFHERFYWPLGIAILLLIAELFVPDRRKPVRRLGAEPASDLKKALATAACFLVCAQALASPRTAQRYFEKGQYPEALREYQSLLQKEPENPELRYNAGAAAYKSGKYDQAIRDFSAALTTPDLDLQQRAYYNLGNAQYRFGENLEQPEQKMASWEQALKQYDNALGLNPADEDARFNRDLVKQRIEELQKQQPQNKSDSDQSGEQDKNEKEDQQQKNQDKQNEQNKSGDDQQNQKEDQQKQQQQEQQSQSSDEKKKEEQSKKQEQQGPDSQDQSEKKEADSSQAKDGQSRQPQEKDKEEEAQQQAAEAASQAGVMSIKQARELLEKHKAEEKALIFKPSQEKKGRSNNIFKDW